MICRLWRGWTTPDNAEAYERVVRGGVIPAIEARALPGFRHIDLVRRALDADRIEFATLMWFDDLDAVKVFAGDDYEASHGPAAARALLDRCDERASHFEVLDCRPQLTAGQVAALDPLPQATGLVVIDVQLGFDDPEWGPRNNREAEANIARLLQKWRDTGRPVFHVRHASTSPTGHFRPDTAGHAFKPEAAPLPGEPVYTKSVNSAFIGTSLEDDLRQTGIATLVVVGLTTNHCVSTTVRMAGNLGFKTLVVADATATFARASSDGRLRPADEVHAAALGDLAGEFADVVETRAVVVATADNGPR